MKLVNRYPLRASIGVAIAFSVFSLIVYYVYADFHEEEFLNRLRSGAISRQELFFEMPEINIEHIHHYDLKRPRSSNLEFVIYDTTGKKLYQSPFAKPALNQKSLNQVKKNIELKFEEGNKTRIIFLYKDDDMPNQMILEVTGINQQALSNQKFLSKILITTTLISVFILIALIAFSVRRDFKPLEEIIEKMNHINDNNLDERLPQSKLPDEFGQMARAFNSLLDRIEKAYSQQKNFVSYATHELRTPLTIMQGQTEVALMKERSSEEYKAALNEVKIEIKETIKLVNDLLELARANVDTHLVDFQAIRVDEALWQARGYLLQTKHDYTVNIEFAEIVDSDEDLIIHGNLSLLKQAFINLMENACKFSDEKSVEILIRVEENKIILKFIDEGSGISEEDLKQIFEPFYRSTTTNSVAGHGMGLPITKKIIEIHKGKCSIESVVGIGTTITITFEKN